jgi:Double-GTPase 2
VIVFFVLLACLVMIIAALLIAPPIILWRGSRQAWRCGRLYLTRLATVLGVPDPATAAQPRLLRHHAEGGREPAYEQYLYAQAWLDLKRALTEVLSDGRAEVSGDWSRTVQEWVAGPWTFNRLWHHLMGLILLAAIALGTLVAAVFTGIIVAVQAVLMAAAAALGIAAARGLRIVDSVLLWFRGIRMHCPNCSRRVSYPSYRCPACDAWHHDIRPGRYGVLRRWCSCGEQSMPTLLILGSHQMQAYCPHPGCEVRLADASGTAAEFTLPILGAAGAGKTRLLTALVMALGDGPGADVTPADDTTARRLDELRPALAGNEPTLPTPPGPARAYSVYVAPPAGVRRLLHLFDTGGGSPGFADLDARRYLRVADSFLFVMDPLSVGRPPAGTGAAAGGAGRSPKDVLDLVAHQAEALGKNLRTSRLGVALTKADVPAGEGVPGPAADSAGIERWLDDSGLDDLTRAMRKLFGDVQYFRTAAVVTDARVDSSVLCLARWLLAGTGLELQRTGGAR